MIIITHQINKGSYYIQTNFKASYHTHQMLVQYNMVQKIGIKLNVVQEWI